MPPKKKPAAAKSPSYCICCQPVSQERDEALFCVGSCQQWLHRYCASVTVQQYKDICSSKSPFQCPTCYRVHSQEQIEELSNAVSVLKLEVAQLRESLASVHTTTAPSRKESTTTKNRATPSSSHAPTGKRSVRPSSG